MEERYKVKGCIAVFLIKNNKILLGLRENTGFGEGERGAPGGRLEKGESFTQGLIREAKEEVGIDIDPSDLKRNFWLYTTREDNSSVILMFWECNTRKGESTITEPDKCKDLQWFDIDHLPENMMKNHKDALIGMLNGETFLEIGF